MMSRIASITFRLRHYVANTGIWALFDIRRVARLSLTHGDCRRKHSQLTTDVSKANICRHSDISPGALVKILVKMGKNVIKLILFQNSYVISCIITYQKPKKILLELISEIASQNV